MSWRGTKGQRRRGQGEAKAPNNLKYAMVAAVPAEASTEPRRFRWRGVEFDGFTPEISHFVAVVSIPGGQEVVCESGSPLSLSWP